MRSINEIAMPADVKADIEAVVADLLSKFPGEICKIILFGSYAKDKYQPDSDIDIAVVLNKMPELKRRRLYKQAVDIEKDVDLVFCLREQLKSDTLVYKHINEQGVVLYEQL